MRSAYRVNCLKILLLLFCIKRGQEKSFSSITGCMQDWNSRSWLRAELNLSPIVSADQKHIFNPFMKQTLTNFAPQYQASNRRLPRSNLLWNLFEKIIKLMKWLMISISRFHLVAACKSSAILLKNIWKIYATGKKCSTESSTSALRLLRYESFLFPSTREHTNSIVKRSPVPHRLLILRRLSHGLLPCRRCTTIASGRK